MEGKINIADLSLKGDLIWAVANAINLEEHLAQTYIQTKDERYLEIYNEVRKLRAKKLEELIIDKTLSGELWCCFKHILALMLRLTEVGIKYQYEGDNQKAKEYFDDASDMFNLFWMLQNFPKEEK